MIEREKITIVKERRLFFIVENNPRGFYPVDLSVFLYLFKKIHYKFIVIYIYISNTYQRF